MSRARNILDTYEGLADAAKKYGPGLAVAGSAAGLATQAALHKRQQQKKVAGSDYAKKAKYAKDRVTLTRVKSAKALGLSKKRRQAVSKAKAHQKKILNKALHSHAQKIAAED